MNADRDIAADPERAPSPARAPRDEGAVRDLSRHDRMLALQRSIGNRAVGAVLARDDGPSPAAPSTIVTPADLPSGTWDVVIVGSPGRGEIAANHPLQFATAAARAGGTSSSTVWLVEQTGYDNGGVSHGAVTALAGSAHVFWITPDHPLTQLIGQFPANSIRSMRAFSHGLVGLLALRHGWGEADYGLSVAEASSLSPTPFAPFAQVSLDSCNAGTGGDGSLAQTIAQAIQRPVVAWTGRTSYREFNRPNEYEDPEVRGSEIWPDGGSPDATELFSQLGGRHPDRFTFTPRHSPGDWTSSFSITARLPRTRTFPVAAGQTVRVTVSGWSDYTHAQGMAVTVQLHRVDTFFDDDVDPNQTFQVGESPRELVWSAPGEGTYYLELWHLSGMLVEGTIGVRLGSPARAALARAVASRNARAPDEAIDEVGAPAPLLPGVTAGAVA